MKRQLKIRSPGLKLFTLMFFISVVLILIGSYSRAADQSEEEIAAALNLIIDRAIRLTGDAVDVEKYAETSRHPEWRNKWFRHTYEIKNLRSKVESKDSSLHPYRATISGTSQARIQGPFDSKNEARSAYSMIQNPTFEGAEFQITYIFENGKWVFEDGKYKPLHPEPGQGSSWKTLWRQGFGGDRANSYGLIYKYWTQTSD